MPNHLASENSPYLLQHANNPVDWYPWGEEALNKAKAEDKPIFLSIGYAACHWCHVMAHESFEDPETAALMNEHFVNIKVDREERPDIDAIYMQATVAMTGSGGWPMSVFLTPDLKPFYAGTYFPPVRRYNMPSFKDVLTGLANAWKHDRAEVESTGGKVSQHLQAQVKPQSREALTPEHLEAIANAIRESYDWGYGGWGDAPKFPQPMALEFLLHHSALRKTDEYTKLIRHCLNAMARGGMYDVVGGGFSRYSTDNLWRVPHFEKYTQGK
ncbi:MAG: thioredoxin domain-containing protein [Chloroflexi bacterium]|nr:thioredoxin domain-containing protein [Chloroflexota bacterium]